MRTADRAAASYRGVYLPPKKYTLVVSCVDARLLDDTVRFLDHDNLTNRYYHAALPGAALCVCGVPLTPLEPKLPLDVTAWQKAFLEQFLLALKLTKFDLTDVYVLQHRDCGAYREYLKDLYGSGSPAELAEEYEVHKSHVELLRGVVKDACKKDGPVHQLAKAIHAKFKPGTTPNVRGFLMDLRGNVDLFVGMPGDRLWDGTDV